MIRRETNLVTLPLKYCETFLISWSRKTQRSTKTEKRRKIDFATDNYEITLLRFTTNCSETHLYDFISKAIFNHIFGFEPRLNLGLVPYYFPSVGKNGQVCSELGKRPFHSDIRVTARQEVKIKKRWSEKN